MRTVFKAVINAGLKHDPWVIGMEHWLPPGTVVDVVKDSEDSLGTTYRTVAGTMWFIDSRDLTLGESYLEFEGSGDYVHHEYTIDALGIQ